MVNGNPNDTIKDSSGEAGLDPPRQYNPPKLVDFGDVRDVTLGGSPGIGDSGPPVPPLKPPG